MANTSEFDQAAEYLQSLFARAGRSDEKYRTAKELSKYLSESGAQRFKRKALGLCGKVTIKSLDEFAQILVETNITPTLAEAVQTVPKIVQASELHGHAINRGGLRYLSFKEVSNPENRTMYRISAWTAD